MWLSGGASFHYDHLKNFKKCKNINQPLVGLCLCCGILTEYWRNLTSLLEKRHFEVLTQQEGRRQTLSLHFIL